MCNHDTVYEGKVCLPPMRPRACCDRCWKRLQEEFKGERCPDIPTICSKNSNLASVVKNCNKIKKLGKP